MKEKKGKKIKNGKQRGKQKEEKGREEIKTKK